MTTKGQVKKEFQEFAGKIDRLKSIKGELDSLDVRGFEREAGIIRTNLKNVNAISMLMRQMSSLKNKVAKGVVKVEKKPKVKVVYRIKKVVEKAEPRIIVREVVKKAEPKVIIKRVKSKPKIIIREIIRKSKPKIIIKEVESKPKIIIREVKSRPKIIIKEVEKKSKVAKPISEGMIDNKFDNFVVKIKKELNDKLKDKKDRSGERLKRGLEKERRLLAQNYRNLVREEHEKYKKKVAHSLKEEVRRKLKEEVEKKFDEERGKLMNSLLESNNRKLKLERERISGVLHNIYSEKEKKLRDKIEGEKNILNRKLKRVKAGEKRLAGKEERHKQEVERINRKFESMKKRENQKYAEMIKKEVA